MKSFSLCAPPPSHPSHTCAVANINEESKISLHLLAFFPRFLKFQVPKEIKKLECVGKGGRCVTIGGCIESPQTFGSLQILLPNACSIILLILSQMVAVELDSFKDSCDKYEESTGRVQTFDSQITSLLFKLDTLDKVSHQMKLLTRRVEIVDECRVSCDVKSDLESEIEKVSIRVEVRFFFGCQKM